MTHKVTLGEVVDLLEQFKNQPITLMIPKMPEGSFAKKLYSLYLSYLPTDKFNYDIKYSGWDSNGENEYLQGNFDKTLNNPTFVKYKDGKPIDIRFDLSSYKDKNDKPINEVTVLVDLWNGGNKN